MNAYSNLLELHYQHQQPYVSFAPKCSHLSTGNVCLRLPIGIQPISLRGPSSRLVVHRYVSNTNAIPFDPNELPEYAPIFYQKPEKKAATILEVLQNANSILPQVVLVSTILAFINPSSFTWFTSGYYAPAIGLLMFAVGLNLKEKDFVEAFKRPAPIFAGYVGQYVLKPLLGLFVWNTVCEMETKYQLNVITGDGIMLTSCVSGATLSNYATFLTDRKMAPLSIVMTSLSTATAVFVTPMLTFLLLGKRLPIDLYGMVSSILQIVVTPVVASLLLNRFFPGFASGIRPFLPPIALVVNFFCIGAPLAINMESIKSPFGISIALIMIMFHLSGFILGHKFTGIVFHNEPDVEPLQRTLSFETGMQSSLLALALANKFFKNPLVGIPPAISVIIMSLMGFSLVKIWAKKTNE
ncbi:bile acid:sodium symporter/arsenical resistance protein Acr3 [Artemisia annua]|uniref:Bile acid:sodium symporter/arsenical resistance protein Acr3 n=1 Tax=Artemisia annua TaxID=35608 RepID=A0A2U1NCZ9_ARTAN|nr:bile acid:sodium symporter/arsenical resistance protein Acr3 [Artemisia annua]